MTVQEFDAAFALELDGEHDRQGQNRIGGTVVLTYADGSKP